MTIKTLSTTNIYGLLSLSNNDLYFLESLPRHAAARVFGKTYNENATITENAAAVTLEKLPRFYKELKKEKAFQEKRARAAAIIANIAAGVTLSIDDMIYIKNLINESISTGSGKLTGINSISTAVFMNCNCLLFSKIAGAICSKCYALKYTGFRSDLSRKLELNTVIYAGALLPLELLPVINARYFRFESFGDLINKTQQLNYFNIVKKNRLVCFAQWTKNPLITAAALRDTVKPHNLQIIYSSKMINNAGNVEKIRDIFPFIDKVFTVYDKQYIKDHNININCGGRSCMNCLNCYTAGGDTVINEKLK